jgi:hypothetical protein
MTDIQWTPERGSVRSRKLSNLGNSGQGGFEFLDVSDAAQLASAISGNSTLDIRIVNHIDLRSLPFNSTYEGNRTLQDVVAPTRFIRVRLHAQSFRR